MVREEFAVTRQQQQKGGKSAKQDKLHARSNRLGCRKSNESKRQKVFPSNKTRIEIKEKHG